MVFNKLPYLELIAWISSGSANKPTDKRPHVAATACTPITPTGSSIFNFSIKNGDDIARRPPIAPMTKPSHGRERAHRP